jgi:phosphoglycerol transferase MdoB-like AlkP superfamily enzyme
MKGVREDAPMECLPHMLAGDLGYRTIYFTHSSPRYAGIGRLLVKWGFQETHLWRGFLREYLENEPPYLGSGGLSDHQMMRGLVNYLERNREQLLRSGPFFIGLSTVETHTGRTPNERDGVRPSPSRSDVDDAFYNMDDAFGHFWRYFRDSSYADNTILIVTADHARFPSLDYKEVAGSDYRPSVYDEVALLVRDPFHRLPERLRLRASTLDFAPSLYHLVGGKAVRPNRFMGRSIFGDRQRTEGVVALSAYRQFGYMVVDGQGLRRRKSFECDAITDPRCDHDSRLLAIVRRLQELVRESRYW